MTNQADDELYDDVANVSMTKPFGNRGAAVHFSNHDTGDHSDGIGFNRMLSTISVQSVENNNGNIPMPTRIEKPSKIELVRNFAIKYKLQVLAGVSLSIILCLLVVIIVLVTSPCQQNNLTRGNTIFSKTTVVAPLTDPPPNISTTQKPTKNVPRTPPPITLPSS